MRTDDLAAVFHFFVAVRMKATKWDFDIKAAHSM